MTVEDAWQCAKDKKELRALVYDWYSQGYFCSAVFIRSALPYSGGYHLEWGGMPLHDVVGVNCKQCTTTENHGACVKYIGCGVYAGWLCVCVLSDLTPPWWREKVVLYYYYKYYHYYYSLFLWWGTLICRSFCRWICLQPEPPLTTLGLPRSPPTSLRPATWIRVSDNTIPQSPHRFILPRGEELETIQLQSLRHLNYEKVIL